MASTFVSGFANGAASEGFYRGDDVAPGTTTQGVSTVGARLALDGAYSSNIDTVVNVATFGASQIAFYSFGFRVTGTLPGAGVFDAAITLQGGTSVQFGIVGITGGTTFNMALGNLAGALSTGATVFAEDTWYDVRIAMDNAGNTVTVWVGATQEIAPYSIAVSTPIFGLSPPVAGGTYYYSCGILAYGDSLDDRPQIQPKGVFMYPAGDNDSTTFGNDNVNCNDGAGTYTDWDDWATIEQDGGTTFVVECGGNNGKEISSLSTATVDTTLTIQGAITVTSSAASAIGKTVATYHVLKDIASTTEAEVAQSNLATTTYKIRKTRWTSPPAGAWTDYINGTTFNHASASKQLAFGVRSVSTNGANDDHSAAGVEIFMWNADPVSTRRRTGPTLASPGIF